MTRSRGIQQVPTVAVPRTRHHLQRCRQRHLWRPCLTRVNTLPRPHARKRGSPPQRATAAAARVYCQYPRRYAAVARRGCVCRSVHTVTLTSAATGPAASSHHHRRRNIAHWFYLHGAANRRRAILSALRRRLDGRGGDYPVSLPQRLPLRPLPRRRAARLARPCSNAGGVFGHVQHGPPQAVRQRGGSMAVSLCRPACSGGRLTVTPTVVKTPSSGPALRLRGLPWGTARPTRLRVQANAVTGSGTVSGLAPSAHSRRLPSSLRSRRGVSVLAASPASRCLATCYSFRRLHKCPQGRPRTLRAFKLHVTLPAVAGASRFGPQSAASFGGSPRGPVKGAPPVVVRARASRRGAAVVRGPSETVRCNLDSSARGRGESLSNRCGMMPLRFATAINSTCNIYAHH